jgi:hypothetical protein
MYRTKLCLQYIAGVSAVMAVPFVPLPARGADTNPSAWRFRTYRAPSEPMTLTVSQGGHGWFEAKETDGKTFRVSLPPKIGSVQQDGKLIATETLRPGDQVVVSGHPSGGHLSVVSAKVMSPETAPGRRN